VARVAAGGRDRHHAGEIAASRLAAPLFLLHHASLSRTRSTVAACHLPPAGVATPRLFSSLRELQRQHFRPPSATRQGDLCHSPFGVALLSFVESAPRAYRLKASNAAPPFSTSAGTSATKNLMPLDLDLTAVTRRMLVPRGDGGKSRPSSGRRRSAGAHKERCSHRPCSPPRSCQSSCSQHTHLCRHRADTNPIPIHSARCSWSTVSCQQTAA
jgi:hypothetical protein